MRRLALLLLLWPLAACIESDPPALTYADLAEVPRLSDRFALLGGAADAPADTVAGFRSADGTYSFLQFRGPMEAPEQVRTSGDKVRILQLSPDRFLVISVYWDFLFSGDIYSLLDLSDRNEYRLLALSLGKAAANESFVESIRTRLGVTLAYVDGMEDDSGIERTHIEGTPTAASLRALFNDREFNERLTFTVQARLRSLNE